MPGIVVDEITEEGVVNEPNGNCAALKENSVAHKSPKGTLSVQSPQGAGIDLPVNGVVETSIEQLLKCV
ncbi:hypothetical protein SLA2020_440280 [Shorea laevis]